MKEALEVEVLAQMIAEEIKEREEEEVLEVVKEESKEAAEEEEEVTEVMAQRVKADNTTNQEPGLRE